MISQWTLPSLKGLLHDSPEVWLGDMPTPVKHSGMMKAYLETEKMFDQEVAIAFMPGVQAGGSVFAAVKPWDKLILKAELRDLFHRKDSTAYADLSAKFPSLKFKRTMPSWVVYRFFKWRYEELIENLTETESVTITPKLLVMELWKWWYGICDAIYLTPAERDVLAATNRGVENA